jgi:transcriptional regulator with XRE-family HTH domain
MVAGILPRWSHYMAPSKAVSGKDFGKRLKELREAHHWSQPRLTMRSGVPTPTIANYEAGKVESPGRDKIVALAMALDWPGGVDVALALAGEGPLSAEERQFLPAPVDLFAEVTQLWPRLSPRVQAAILELLNAICEPHGPTRTVTRDPAARSRSKTITTPREPSVGTTWSDQARSEARR